MLITFYPSKYLEEILYCAAKECGLNASYEAQMRPADPRFGDFQSNGSLAYAKKEKLNPRELSQKIIDAIKANKNFDESFVEVSIAGPGFINFKLTEKYLSSWIKKFDTKESLKNAASEFNKGKKIIVDYPSPNTAKQMHVGHLRPMVIGEAVQRLLRFCGGDVICDNHIGDWGTNFGILIYAIKTEKYKLDVSNENSLEELEALYKVGSSKAKENPEAADAARNELVKLQSGDVENTKLWEDICAVSKSSFDKMYQMLGVTCDICLGESFYRDKVDRIYSELEGLGLAEESLGALVVFFKDNPQFEKQPFIIRKSDGASNYASTDLATILYRVENLHADEIVYVTDGRQQDHFKQLFLTAEKWFALKNYKLPTLKHVWFGTILGEDGKAIKTKSGEPVRLKSLIEEGVSRARKVVEEKNPDMSKDEIENISRVVGISAMKYADLSQNRTGDYTFSWDKLLSFEGNTAPYLLYAVARIHSIFRKANISLDSNFEENASALESEQEIALARKLIALPSVFELTLSELRPHHLCTYLYELAGAFSAFYNTNKVITDDIPQMQRRLLLCARTLTFMESSLNLLGIETLEKM